jgi:hypothetical protein
LKLQREKKRKTTTKTKKKRRKNYKLKYSTTIKEASYNIPSIAPIIKYIK